MGGSMTDIDSLNQEFMATFFSRVLDATSILPAHNGSSTFYDFQLPALYQQLPTTYISRNPQKLECTARTGLCWWRCKQALEVCRADVVGISHSTSIIICWAAPKTCPQIVCILFSIYPQSNRSVRLKTLHVASSTERLNHECPESISSRLVVNLPTLSVVAKNEIGQLLQLCDYQEIFQAIQLLIAFLHRHVSTFGKATLQVRWWIFPLHPLRSERWRRRRRRRRR